jgi:hypothetical protein
MWSRMGNAAFAMLAVLFRTSSAYPGSLSCSKQMTVGSQIMGRSATSSSATMRWKRGRSPILCGGTYVPGETLTLETESLAGQFMLEVSGGAKISGGTCSNRRKANSRSVSVVMPSGDGVQVSAWAGHGSAYSSGIQVTSKCSLSAASPPAHQHSPHTHQPHSHSPHTHQPHSHSPHTHSPTEDSSPPPPVASRPVVGDDDDDDDDDDDSGGDGSPPCKDLKGSAWCSGRKSRCNEAFTKRQCASTCSVCSGGTPPDDGGDDDDDDECVNKKGDAWCAKSSRKCTSRSVANNCQLKCGGC